MSKKTLTTRGDVAEHLRTPEEMAACREASIEEARGDAAFIAKALGDTARARGMAQVARETRDCPARVSTRLYRANEAPVSTPSSRLCRPWVGAPCRRCARLIPAANNRTRTGIPLRSIPAGDGCVGRFRKRST